MAAGKIKGDITLRVNEQELTAFIVFAHNKEGEEWDASKVINLLSRNKVVEGYTPGSVEDVIGKLSKTKEKQVEIVIAKGTEPELPVPEEYKWEELPIPEENQALAKDVLSATAEPEIVTIKIEKIKKKKKILKKQKLPFLPPKEEIVEVVEKLEVPERIYVDPEVIGSGWVNAGEKIAIIYPSKPGKMGKTVHGLPIMPPQPGDADIYPGKGVEKKKGEITASATGFLRRGKNWVEVIPFTLHSWDLTLSPDMCTCLLNFTPGDPRAPLPDAADIIATAEKIPYPARYLLTADEIAARVKEAAGDRGKGKGIPLSGDKDGAAEIIVSEDKLKATLHLTKGRGNGKPLSLKETGNLLRDSKLKNLNFPQIKTDIMGFYKSPQAELTGYTLCEGRPSDSGKDAGIEIQTTFVKKDAEIQLKKRLADAPPDPFITSTAEFPMESVEAFSFVVRHQPIARIGKAGKGKDGLDVYGNVISCGGSGPPKYKLFENLKLEKEEIISEKSGILEKGSSSDGTILLRVRPHKDCEIEVEVGADKMQALLFISRPEGAGTKPSADTVRNKIKEAGVIKGIIEESLTEAVTASNRGEEIRGLVIAKGLEPVHASKNKIEFHVHFASGEKVTIKKDGTADFKNQHTITMVMEGDQIAEIIAPETSPADGWDISGKALPAKSKADFDLTIGNNITQQEDDKGNIRLLAAKSGELIYDKKFIDIKDAHAIQGNVNLKTGNIKFMGSVQISGSIESGFRVIAGQSIMVGDSVEAALLSAEKDIIINAGVKGAGKAILRSKDAIKAGFIEQALVLAVGDIFVKNYCLRSQVKSNGKLVLESEKGHLIGGSVKARKGIEVMNLGSQTGAKTQVSFGQDYLVNDQIELEEKEIEKVKEQILKYDNYLHGLEKKGLKAKLESARQEKLKFLKIIEKRTMRLFTLREKFEEHFPAIIKVRGTAFPGTIIESHGRYLEVRKEAKSVTFEFDLKTGQIQQKTLEK